MYSAELIADLRAADNLLTSISRQMHEVSIWNKKHPAWADIAFRLSPELAGFYGLCADILEKRNAHAETGATL